MRPQPASTTAAAPAADEVRTIVETLADPALDADVVLIDFEGDTDRPLSERRLKRLRERFPEADADGDGVPDLAIGNKEAEAMDPPRLNEVRVYDGASLPGGGCTGAHVSQPTQSSSV